METRHTYFTTFQHIGVPRKIKSEDNVKKMKWPRKILLTHQ